MGVRVDKLTMTDALNWTREKIRTQGKNQYILAVNVAKIVKAKDDAPLKDIINTADLVIADGMPVVWASKLLGGSLQERVAGIDLMAEMLKAGNKEKWSFYFLGATQEIIETVVGKVRREFPNVRIAGFKNGYFKEQEEEKVVAEIRASGANILFLGFGSPKKELFAEKWKNQLGVNIIHGVGGSFDVYAGLTKRAPVWMQNTGLEWFYRFMQEPRRMFKRYFTTNSTFLIMLLKEVLRSSQKSKAVSL